MKTISILLLIFLCLFSYSFSNKNETIKVSDDTRGYVKSIVQSTEQLKLHINSPMKLGEYTACLQQAGNENDKSSLIKSASKDILFIPNKGQIIDTEGKLRPDILYKAALNGIDLYLTNKGMSFVFYKYEDAPKNLAAGDKESEEMHIPFKDYPVRERKVKMYRMDLDIIGMNTNFKTLNEEQTIEYFNYYYAHCPDGVTNVHGYRKVIYENVYDNVDLVYYSNEKGLKYDFVVKPGGDASDIKLKYKNNGDVYITKEGKIKALNPLGEIETDVLYTYQSDGKVVASNYIKDTDGTIRINTGDYDRAIDLIIDPYIGATYYGGNDWESGETIMTDTDNNILVTGSTTSTNFPVQNPGGGYYYQGTNAGYDDIYILKFDSVGIRQWATYYGGSRTEYGLSSTTDVNGNILVTGSIYSTDFPLYNPGGGAYFQSSHAGVIDIYILKFNKNGIRRWATYYGGNSTEMCISIATDVSTNIFLTGETASSNFPIYNPGGGAYYQEFVGPYGAIFILKFDSNGTRKWATYYSGFDQGDYGNSISADNNNNILVTGGTRTPNFPVYDPGGGAYFQGTFAGGNADGFILKFNENGVRRWATYYGGSGDESVEFITTDESNNTLISGITFSTDFPLYNPGGGAYYQGSHAGGMSDAFIVKFDSSNIRRWATYYGGSDNDNVQSIATDVNNYILITGNTFSTNFPLQNPGGSAYFQNYLAGGRDVFILKFKSSGIRQWATYYGGNIDDGGNSIAADLNKNIFVTGYTMSANFPVFNPGGGAYFQSSHGGDVDAFILGFDSSGVISDIQNMGKIIPEVYTLYQNYPNPFNPTTKINFEIPKSSHVKLIVYDILGKEIATLVNEKLDAGSYETSWDGSSYPSGVYLYKLETGEFANGKKMLLIK